MRTIDNTIEINSNDFEKDCSPIYTPENIEFYPSYQKGQFNLELSQSKSTDKEKPATITEYQKIFSNIRMGELPEDTPEEQATNPSDIQQQEALEFFRRQYIQDKQGFEELEESMFEDNTQNINSEPNIDPERNPLSLQPLYINNENLLKYIPDKDYANQIISAGGLGGVFLPISDQHTNVQQMNEKDIDTINVFEYLESVKNKQEQFDYRKVKDHLIEVCENETGSFKIQEIFNSGAYNEKKEIFDRIKCQIQRLITNKFGNYVIQKIVEKCSRGMKEHIVESIREHFSSFCLDYYASKVIKKMFDCFDPEMRYGISVILLINCYNYNNPTQTPTSNFENFSHTFITLMCNSDASIIIQKLIEKGFYPKLKDLKHPDFCYSANAMQIYTQYQGLLQVINSHVVELAQDVYGCRVMNICMETFPIHILDGIIQQIMANLAIMVNHKYANYVVQSLIEFNSNFYHDSLKKFIKENAKKMCVNKFSSFVIEKVAKNTHKSIKQELYDMVFNYKYSKMKNDLKSLNISRMLYNEYGNFILKRLYEFEDDRYLKREYKKKIIDIYQKTYVHNNFYAHKLVNQLRDDQF